VSAPRRYRSLTALQRDLAACRRCPAAGHPVASLPVLHAAPDARAYLFGHAPGPVEGEERRPWRGRAGRTLRRWLELEEEDFYRVFHCASVTRCYPGRSPSGRGDRVPTPAERALCAPWRDEELRLLRPALVVTVGGLAARTLLGLSRLTDVVGKSFTWDDAIAVPLPHPSGASGWLNDPVNRARLGKAIVHVRRELHALAGTGTPFRVA
jgi:uracil-DNA glycosylase